MGGYPLRRRSGTKIGTAREGRMVGLVPYLLGEEILATVLKIYD